jgi:hypothetical protein
MFKFNRILVTTAVLAATLNPSMLLAAPADVSSGTLELSGSIPEIFSLQVRGVPGDLDFSPNVVVNDRLLGIFHLKYNIPVASIILSSDSATGLPTLNGAGATAVPLGTDMTYTVTCGSVGASGTGLTAVNLGAGATNINAAAANVETTNGFEEDCPLTASWVGTAGVLPVAGSYSMTITITMTST